MIERREDESLRDNVEYLMARNQDLKWQLKNEKEKVSCLTQICDGITDPWFQNRGTVQYLVRFQDEMRKLVEAQAAGQKNETEAVLTRMEEKMNSDRMTHELQLTRLKVCADYSQIAALRVSISMRRPTKIGR